MQYLLIRSAVNFDNIQNGVYIRTHTVPGRALLEIIYRIELKFRGSKFFANFANNVFVIREIILNQISETAYSRKF